MKNRYFRWTIEFLSIIAISYILTTHTIRDYWITVLICLVLYSKLVEHRMSISEAQAKIQVQLNFLYKVLFFAPQDNVRCTFHTPIWRNRLLQSCNYIPTGGGVGRTFPSDKGIIGKAYQQKESFVVNFVDDQEYSQWMVSDYGYTHDEVKQRTTDRRSYFCHPLIDEEHKVLGLVYFDSSTYNKFPNTTNQQMRDLIIKLDLIRDSII